tara:strand:- start:67 stop:453 length:387 start_codon:yes stop_codon:yes gene_type:complete
LVITTPEKYLRSKYKSLYQARARQGIEWSIKVQDLIDLWHEQRGICSVTGLHMQYQAYGTKRKTTKGAPGKANLFNVSVDRIDNTGSYNKGNLRLVCFAVNKLKSGLTESDFVWWIRTINKGLKSDER